ncbi:MAG: arginine deiminase-related protein [Bacteroidetes bacterium]|nr:arginine deiminase-related protein [Bacteroidota bacterium]MDA1121301.1 arginine deiminase-related protein [Bacteroidota bacterium]
MIPVKILDEIAPLELVVLGTAKHFGGVPNIEDTHDPKSREHIIDGTYPVESDLIKETDQFKNILEKYGVTVLRPQIINNLNQIFSRDIGIAIDDSFIVPKVTYNRRKEVEGIRTIIDQIDPIKVLEPHVDIRMEGGDIMPCDGKIFVGYSKKADWDEYIVSRTNEAGVEYLKVNFSDWEIVPFELRKSDDNARENALHLDCCFQPLGKGKAIVHKNGLK